MFPKILPNRFRNVLQRVGTRVALSYRTSEGHTKTVHTRAMVNAYPRKMFRTNSGSPLGQKAPADLHVADDLVLFLPYDAMQCYDHKSDIYVTLRGTEYVMTAFADIPINDRTCYIWMIVSPRCDAADGYDDFDGGAADEA